ncbi:MAG TPA: DUF4351 domain-containing protein [Humisphaera sp.]|jgi:hypothetical protein|nr:DUF4351 domain-containing protein [Humisphaera sp.]
MQIVNQWEERAAKRTAVALVTRMLQRKFGELPARLRGQIEKLPQEKVEALGEAMLDFTRKQEIQGWLRREA